MHFILSENYHEEASTVADHIPDYFLKLCIKGLLTMFDLFCQDIAREAKWKDDQTWYEDELNINEANTDNIEL